jgi:hypothetical protein
VDAAASQLIAVEGMLLLLLCLGHLLAVCYLAKSVETLALALAPPGPTHAPTERGPAVQRPSKPTIGYTPAAAPKGHEE